MTFAGVEFCADVVLKEACKNNCELTNTTMWLALVPHLVRHERELVHCANSADAYMAVLGVPYPFPAPDHTFWTTLCGKALDAAALDMQLTRELLHSSPAAAAKLLFGKRWVACVTAECRARMLYASSATELRHAVVSQLAREQGIDDAASALLLCTATKTWHAVDGVDTFRAYITYDATGYHIDVWGDQDDVAAPDSGCMQDTLSSAEQMDYLILCSPPCYTRVAYGQPLPGKPLALCSKCAVGAGATYDGSAEDVLVAPGYCAHASCAAPPSAARAALPEAKVMCTTGLVEHKGACYLRASKWAAKSAHLGLIHPVSLPAMVAKADELIRVGRWRSLVGHAKTASGRCGTTNELSAHLAMYGHVIATGQVPDVYSDPATVSTVDSFSSESCLACYAPTDIYPARGDLAQSACPRSAACILDVGLYETLRALRIYQEPQFTQMCRRFVSEGVRCLDSCLSIWMQKRLPVLTGDVSAADSDLAPHMHGQATASLTSLKTRQRMWASRRAPEHWAVSEVDTVLPRSKQVDRECMQELGMSPSSLPCSIAAAPAPPAVADVAGERHKRRRVSTGVHTTYPVRVMLNPSANADVLRMVLDQCPYDVAGAMQHFVEHEIPPIGCHVTDEHVQLFRAACIRSVLYGRVYLWMCVQPYGAERHDCGSSLLASDSHTSERQWHGSWDAVRMLSRCTDAQLVVLGAGCMPYWRQIMSGNPTFVFERSLACLQQLSRNVSPLPHNLHIVPCHWSGLQVHDIVSTGAAVVVARAGASLPERGAAQECHYMHPRSKPELAKSGFLCCVRDKCWKMTTCDDAHEKSAAHALTMLRAM